MSALDVDLAQGSRLKAQGSRLKAQGSRLKRKVKKTDRCASSAFHMVAEHSGVPGCGKKLVVGPCPVFAGTSGYGRKPCRGVGAQDAPAPVLTPEEEFDLFGPSDGQNSFTGAASSGAASAEQSPVTAKAAAPPVPPGFVGLDQNLVAELLRNQQEMLRQNRSHAEHGN